MTTEERIPLHVALQHVYAIQDPELPRELSHGVKTPPDQTAAAWDWTGFSAVERAVAVTFDLIRAEAATLDRIIYKNTNQHNRSVHFRHLKEVQRRLRELINLHVRETAHSLRLLVNAPTLKRSDPGSAGSLPCQQALRFLLLRIILAASSGEQVLVTLVTASRQLVAMLSQTYFMPFGVTNLALLSRVYVLQRRLLLHLSQLFKHGMHLCPLLPGEKKSRSTVPEKEFDFLKVTLPEELQISSECDSLALGCTKSQSISHSGPVEEVGKVSMGMDEVGSSVGDEDFGEVVTLNAGNVTKSGKGTTPTSHRRMDKSVSGGKRKHAVSKD